MIKHSLLLLALLASLLFSGKSAAQQVPQGPFTDYRQLIAAWQQFDIYGAGRAFQDGQLIFQREGFGPAAIGYYYGCPAEGLIRINRCPENGPFYSIGAIQSYWSQWAAASVTATRITVNNQLVYTFTDGFGPAMTKNYVYCTNRGAYMVNCNQ